MSVGMKEVPFQVVLGRVMQMTQRVPRDADTLNKILFHLHTFDPEGYRWKPNWVYSFVKRLVIKIGGHVICETNTQQLWMEHRIHGKHYVEEDGEVLFEPLKVSEIFLDPTKRLPLIAIAFHNVDVVVDFGDVLDCLEPTQDNPPPLPNNLFYDCSILYEYGYLDRTERTNISTERHRLPIRHNQYCSCELDTETETKIHIGQNGICSAAYLWITDENDCEIPRALERIHVKAGGHIRWDLSGLQCRTQMRSLLPHSTPDHTQTENLYFLSYFPGRRSEDGLEQGFNLTQVDMYSWELFFRAGVPPRIKLHIVHRVQNRLLVASGMALPAINTNFSYTRVVQNVPLVERVPVTTEPIDILPGKVCMITYTEFENGEQVEKCNQCREVFHSEALQRWLAGKPIHQQKCVHCSFPYNTTNFQRGRASISADSSESDIHA